MHIISSRESAMKSVLLEQLPQMCTVVVRHAQCVELAAQNVCLLGIVCNVVHNIPWSKAIARKDVAMDLQMSQ